MTRGGTMLLACGLVFMVAARPVKADVPASPYQGIIDRNVFDLRPLPKPEDNLAAADPPPKITLTGFTTILGDKRVLFKVMIPGRPPLPPKEESYILTEGQRDGDIEAIEVDEKAGVAKFNNHGTIQTLNIADDGAKPSNLPPPAPANRPGRQFSPFGPRPAPFQPPVKSIPARTLRIPQIPGVPFNRQFPSYRGPQPPAQ